MDLSELSLPSADVQSSMRSVTKKQHDQLNKLIMERLQLALPPCTTSLEAYGRGLAVFAQIYYAFEQVADELFLSKKNEVGFDAERISILSKMFVPGLCRSARLMRDIDHISAVTNVDVSKTLTAEQRELFRGTRSSILAKPHVLIAYAWIMYMAVFSGGRRYVRGKLLAAGPASWYGIQQQPSRSARYSVVALDLPGLTFLSFDGEHDGDDIKAEFLARLTDIEPLLTRDERQDIVEAAEDLFDECIEFVRLLDGVFQQRVVRKRRARPSSFWIIGLVVLVYLLFPRSGNK